MRTRLYRKGLKVSNTFAFGTGVQPTNTAQSHGFTSRGKGGVGWVGWVALVERLDRIWWNYFRESLFTGELIFSTAYYPSFSSVVEDEMLWSFSLSHGLRLTIPLRFMIAKRVATRHSEHRSSATSMPRPAQ